MSTTIENLAANQQFIKTLGIGTATSLSFLGGISACLSAWIIPLLRRSSSPASTIAQFELMIEKGFKYLQTSSRVLAAALASLTYLTYSSSNPAIRGQWKFWATAMGILIPLAPFEIYFIFPSNHRIADIGEELKMSAGDELRENESKELDTLFTKWQWRNGVRFTTPVVASVIGLAGMLQS